MLNRCSPYQQLLQILSMFHLLLIKSSPRHKRANTLIGQGSGKKNNPCRQGALSSPFFFCDFPQPTAGGDKRSRRTNKCGDEEQLVKMVDDKQRAPCRGEELSDAVFPLGGFTRACIGCVSCPVDIHHSDLFWQGLTSQKSQVVQDVLCKGAATRASENCCRNAKVH